jgi:predicted lipid-binding transport protein (Tim44 family)
MKLFTVLLALVLTLGAMNAEAARLGGGRSIGRMSPHVTQLDSAPPAVAPRAPSNAQNGSVPPQTPPLAQPRSRWGGMLGGLAAGLGLAWLAHSLGFGAGFGNILLIALVAMVALMIFGRMRARRDPGYAYQGATVDAPASPPQYNPQKVGNDASARPWESGFDVQHAQSGVRIGSAVDAAGGLDGSQNWGVPAGFDSEGFLQAAKRNFVTLQEAWDRSDTGTLRSMMTDEMLQEIRTQIAERDRQPAVTPQKTDVVMLEAKLLGIEDLPTEYMASVEFSGMMREEASAGPAPFREVWNMIKPKSGTAGWLVAGVQALQ